jgi:hypothetical protein
MQSLRYNAQLIEIVTFSYSHSGVIDKSDFRQPSVKEHIA